MGEYGAYEFRIHADGGRPATDLQFKDLMGLFEKTAHRKVDGRKAEKGFKWMRRHGWFWGYWTCMIEWHLDMLKSTQ
jgi:hypothetical protein